MTKESGTIFDRDNLENEGASASHLHLKLFFLHLIPPDVLAFNLSCVDHAVLDILCWENHRNVHGRQHVHLPISGGSGQCSPVAEGVSVGRMHTRWKAPGPDKYWPHRVYLGVGRQWCSTVGERFNMHVRVRGCCSLWY